MHVFPNPIKEAERFQLWVSFVGRKDLMEKIKFTVRKNYRICDLHFKDSQKFVSGPNNITNLKRSSIPEIFSPSDSARLIDAAGTSFSVTSVGEYVEPFSSANFMDTRCSTALAAPCTISTSKDFDSPVTPVHFSIMRDSASALSAASPSKPKHYCFKMKHGIEKLCTICHVILRDTDTSQSIFSTLEELESAMNVLQVLQSFSNVHTGENSFTCEFATQSSLLGHIYNVEEAHKCDRRFTRAQHLRTHISIHNGVKAHKCEQCDRRFADLSNLRRHMNMHNGVKAFTCEQCDRGFTDPSTLRRHMDIHNGEKAYQCDRRFTQAQQLRRHMDMHNGVNT